MVALGENGLAKKKRKGKYVAPQSERSFYHKAQGLARTSRKGDGSLRIYNKKRSRSDRLLSTLERFVAEKKKSKKNKGLLSKEALRGGGRKQYQEETPI